MCGVQWSYKRCRIAFHHLGDAGTACAHQRRPAAVTIERYTENINRNKIFQKLGSGLAPPSKAGSVHALHFGTCIGDKTWPPGCEREMKVRESGGQR